MTWQASVFPEARDRLGELEAELWAPGRMDPVVLELCRLRLAQLLDDRQGLDQRTPAALQAGSGTTATHSVSPFKGERLDE